MTPAVNIETSIARAMDIAMKTGQAMKAQGADAELIKRLAAIEEDLYQLLVDVMDGQ